MNFFERTSIKIRFLYLVLAMVIFSIAAALMFLHTIHSVAALGVLQKNIDTCFSAFHDLEQTLYTYGGEDSGQPEKRASLQLDISRTSGTLLDQIRQLKSQTPVADDSRIIPLLDSITLHIRSFTEDMTGSGANGKAQYTELDDPGLTRSMMYSRYIKPVMQARLELQEAFYSASSEQLKKYAQNLVFLLFTSIAVIFLLVSLSEISNYRNVSKLLKFTTDLDRGDRKTKIHLSSGREFRDISQNLNNFLEKQSKKIRFLKTIGEGENTYRYEPEKTDILGNEIRIMAARLQKSRQEEAARQSEDSRRNWTSEGIAQFSELLRSENENVGELAYLVIQKLVTYLQIEMGTLFLTQEQEKKEPLLETIAAYAYDRRKYINKTFRFGEGLPGTCAIEKEKIYMNDIPDSFSDIISGVGQTRPKHALLVPLKIGEEIFGVVELASFRAFEKHEFDFIDQVADIIASGLQTVRNNDRTAALLQQSRDQAKQLSQQEEELRINLQKLEQTREESLKKESEIDGLLHAINASTLVAEFSPEGRFIHINDTFRELLEVPANMVLGKHHAEFTGSEKYTDAYKEFWDALKSGIPVTREEKFILYSGKEVWLQQTYTPIIDSEERVSRILDIAVDITQVKKQQEELESVLRELENLRKEKG